MIDKGTKEARDGSAVEKPNGRHGALRGATSDHSSGEALDLMVPGYRTAAGRALGLRIAAWARRNNATLRIEYVIHNQRIWNVRRAGEGWRPMAGRGSDSANHKDHVHVTMLD